MQFNLLTFLTGIFLISGLFNGLSADAKTLSCSAVGQPYLVEFTNGIATVRYDGLSLGGGTLKCIPGAYGPVYTCTSIQKYMRKDTSFVGFSVDVYKNQDNSGMNITLDEQDAFDGKTWGVLLAQLSCK